MHQSSLGLQELPFSQTQALQIRELRTERRLETNDG